ncbi:MAG: hypothetical protein GAK34_00779 [Delftia tsuruhatensis]|nr:MAG: hypothetical protein GAK34_00779 [Delftia tsuruhatensis]
MPSSHMGRQMASAFDSCSLTMADEKLSKVTVPW